MLYRFFSPSACGTCAELGRGVLFEAGLRSGPGRGGAGDGHRFAKSGFAVAIEASEATAESMAAAIVKHFSSPLLFK